MKKLELFVAAGLSAMIIGSPPAWAGRNSNAKILLHITNNLSCKRMTVGGNEPTCDQIVTQGDLYPDLYLVSMLVTDGNADAGIQGLSCGIEYDSGQVDGIGVDIFSWIATCWFEKFDEPGSLPPWPASGSSNQITWKPDACQRYEPGAPGTGVVAFAGYFYLASYPDPAHDNVSRLRVVPRASDGIARVWSCETPAVTDTVAGGSIEVPGRLGYVTFSPGATVAGYNPCGLITPVLNTTWSRLKLIREN